MSGLFIEVSFFFIILGKTFKAIEALEWEYKDVQIQKDTIYITISTFMSVCTSVGVGVVVVVGDPTLKFF